MEKLLNKVFELSKDGQITGAKHLENGMIVYTQIQNEMYIDSADVLNFIQANSSLFEVEVIEETEEISLKFCGEEIFGFNSDFIEI